MEFLNFFYKIDKPICISKKLGIFATNPVLNGKIDEDASFLFNNECENYLKRESKKKIVKNINSDYFIGLFKIKNKTTLQTLKEEILKKTVCLDFIPTNKTIIKNDDYYYDLFSFYKDEDDIESYERVKKYLRKNPIMYPENEISITKKLLIIFSFIFDEEISTFCYMNYSWQEASNILWSIENKNFNNKFYTNKYSNYIEEYESKISYLRTL